MTPLAVALVALAVLDLNPSILDAVLAGTEFILSMIKAVVLVMVNLYVEGENVIVVLVSANAASILVFNSDCMVVEV
jgi:hypothetical protein